MALIELLILKFNYAQNFAFDSAHTRAASNASVPVAHNTNTENKSKTHRRRSVERRRHRRPFMHYANRERVCAWVFEDCEPYLGFVVLFWELMWYCVMCVSIIERSIKIVFFFFFFSIFALALLLNGRESKAAARQYTIRCDVCTTSSCNYESGTTHEVDRVA